MDHEDLGLLFLHALPLDGSMWSEVMGVLPGSTFAPTLYGFGTSIEDWADGALSLALPRRLIVVGCSVGGSCALEIAAAAPERVEALVLIGTKPDNRYDPDRRDSAIEMLNTQGVETAWSAYWEPLFSRAANPQVVERAKRQALSRPPHELARGVEVFYNRPSRGDIAKNWQKTALVITGEDDTAPGVEASAALAASMPSARCEIVQRSGHFVPLERPDALRSILEGLIAAL